MTAAAVAGTTAATRPPTAVVSGGTRGIGLAFSRRLVKLGFRVNALYRSDEDGARGAVRELGPRLNTVRVDLSDGASVAEAAEAVVAEYGPPVVLVNNAGMNVDRPFLEMSHDDWRRVIDTNLSGVFYLTRALAPAMVASDTDATIVNVGATTGIRPRRNGANYCASKAGLLHLTKCLALELAPRVRVNCLIPGNTETDELVERFNLNDPDARRGMLDEIPQRRIADPEEIADALEFLVGPNSAYMTGQKLVVDGGQFMW
ncbi:SDR family oxidoreductase [Streptomyces sp. SID8361]|uniref:SDR family NAD(P)-dependent oxidoreductase n=1 Tax=Streptomyces sp. MnatMP-M27 TaxID=1839768 RepID=UPI00081D3A42|nr:SDR family NAD(P)-dependent oxidoreductase [Streptomyces sp. MnatMP-M27]MYU10802.1 SDR family oxidoreductase [Streptomyces sp. SID8361]SCF75569.1 acetoacetyl-CoA reductase/3-oxoacyl-[acyl-carrier protein] reductase [Streptomyces sp. MnatMP-M27]